ncbi:RRP12-like protein [Bombus bifarius]|uniref:RRP12-like protein n=1 Tax=Bombus bifarius TaxID=103933 RepID=A0A6P8MXZ6_9HYME|nr:RRP12-like protein [Bombus bifarius]
MAPSKDLWDLWRIGTNRTPTSRGINVVVTPPGRSGYQPPTSEGHYDDNESVYPTSGRSKLELNFLQNNFLTTQPTVAINSKIVAIKWKDREFKATSDGCLIITVDNEKDNELEPKRKKKSALLLHSDSEDDYEDDVQSVAMSQAMDKKTGGSGIHRPLKRSRTECIPGAEYKASKAGGDVKRKGKPDPYAYVPLSRAALNKRKKKKNASIFQNIIKGAKRDAKIGMKQRKN